MAIKKYSVKASAEAKAVVASKGEYISAAQFSDTLKSAKKKFNEKFKKGPYACAEVQGMGYIYYNDGSKIYVPNVLRSYDDALAQVKKLNAGGAGKVAASKSFKKTVKASSSLKVKPYVINKGQSGEYYGLKNAEDNQVLHSAPNNWKSEKGAINWAKKKGYEVVDSACGKKSVKAAATLVRENDMEIVLRDDDGAELRVVKHPTVGGYRLRRTLNSGDGSKFQWDLSKEIYDTAEEAKQAALEGKATFHFKERKTIPPKPVQSSTNSKTTKKQFGVKASKSAKKRVSAAQGYWADDINAESYRKILQTLDDYLIANYDGRTIGDVEIGVSGLRNVKNGIGSKIEIMFYCPDYDKDTKLEIISAPELRSKFLGRVSDAPFKFDDEFMIRQSGCKQVVVDKINEIADMLSNGSIEGACGKKRKVKASTAAKKRKAIKASVNYNDWLRSDMSVYMDGGKQMMSKYTREINGFKMLVMPSYNRATDTLTYVLYAGPKDDFTKIEDQFISEGEAMEYAETYYEDALADSAWEAQHDVDASTKFKRKAIQASGIQDDIVMYFNGDNVYQGSVYDLADAVENLCYDDEVNAKFQEWCNQFGDPFDFDGSPIDTARVFTDIIIHEAEEAPETENGGSQFYEDGNGILDFEILYANDSIYSAKSIKAGINAPDTDGPLCVCEHCLQGIESHEGRQVIYNEISEFDIEPEDKLICDWCEEESDKLYQISPDEVNGAKSIHAYIDEYPNWVYDWSESKTKKNKQLYDSKLNEWYDKAESMYPNFYQLKGDDRKNAISDVNKAIGFTMDDVFTSSIKCTQGDFTDDFSEDEFPFRVTSYYDHSQRGIADGASFDDMDEAVAYAHEKLSEGPVRIEHYDVGAVDINPDEYWENFDGEFWCTPELAEWRDEVWKSMGIGASKSIKCSDADGYADEWEDIREVASPDTYTVDYTDGSDELEYIEGFINNNYDVYLSVDRVEYRGPYDWVVDYGMTEDQCVSDFANYVDTVDPSLYSEVFDNYEEYNIYNFIFGDDIQGQFYPGNKQLDTPYIFFDEKFMAKIGLDVERFKELAAKYGADRLKTFNDIQTGLEGDLVQFGQIVFGSTDITATTHGSNPVYVIFNDNGDSYGGYDTYEECIDFLTNFGSDSILDEGIIVEKYNNLDNPEDVPVASYDTQTVYNAVKDYDSKHFSASINCADSLNLNAKPKHTDWILRGYRFDGEDVDTLRIDFQDDVRQAVAEMFADPDIDTVDLYKISTDQDTTGVFEDEEYFNTITRDDFESSADINAAIDIGNKTKYSDNPIYEFSDYVEKLSAGVQKILGDDFEVTASDEAITFTKDGEVVYIQPTEEIIPEPEDLESDIDELATAVNSVLYDKAMREDFDRAWDETYDEDYATQAVELSRDINCAEETVDIDDLEYITGDSDDLPDMGYGFDSNGDPVDESTVEELERIAQEILDESEIHNIDEYADLHNFNYYASIPYIQESFDITFTYVADIYELSERGLVNEYGIFTTVAPYNIRFNVRCKNGEVEYAECTDIDVRDGYVKDVELKNFNLDALVQFATDLVNPVAKDIYYGTTNI